MTLSPNKTGVALSVTFALLYVACALLTMLWPAFVFGIGAAWAHSVSLTPGGPLTFGAFLYGLVSFAVFGYITGALFALVWNMQRPATRQ